MRRMWQGIARLGLAAAACAVFVLANTAPALGASTSAGPPIDYTRIKNLSQPIYETTRDELRVPMADGTELYVEVVRPTAAGRFPVILEASPYHGTLADRDGTRILPEPTDGDGKPLGLTRYFAPRGYAVVMVDLRGTGRSQGCLDHLGQKDGTDLKEIIEWAAGREWSNGRVGMTGHSYVGSTPSLAAAMRPEGLETIVPSAGLASMYDHQFQAGVEFYLQWAGPQWSYAYLATARHMPPVGKDPAQGANTGDDFGNNTESSACAFTQSALVSGEDQLSGRYADWHKERDWRTRATEAPIPVFLVHGVNDNAARIPAADWFFERSGERKGYRDKLWLGQWDHGSGCCPNRRGIQWAYALHAWFDKWLAQRKVDTGPPVEVFLGDGSLAEVRAGARTEELTGKSPPVPRMQTLYPTSDHELSGEAGEAGSLSFTGDQRGFASNPFASGGLSFSMPIETDTVLVGLPKLTLSTSVTAPRMHLIAGLYQEFEREGEDGPETVRRRISEFAMNPELRDGIATRSNVTPGQRYELQPPAFRMAEHLRPGDNLVLRITTSSPDKAPLFGADPRVTVFTGPEASVLQLPVIDRPVLYPDEVPLELPDGTPLGLAQPSIEGEVTPTAPGAGVRIGGVTSEQFEFDVEEGFDNASSAMTATPAESADIDLFLQRQEPDGSWSDDLAVGDSSSTTSETLETGRLKPGHYRLDVHEWLGAPATPVDLRIDFFNQNGEPGAAPAG